MARIREWGARICELLGIAKAVLQGGMACVSTATLAAAVSNAGGFGIIATGRMTPEELRDEIRRIKGLTDKPFGVNIMAVDAVKAQALIDVLIEEGGVTAVTIGAGVFRQDKVSLLQSAGVKVIPLVAEVKWANYWLKLGVDALIVEGLESGGHIGNHGLFDILSDIIALVAGRIPVIAAGGIYDGQSAAKAILAGAEGVQVGTAFLVAEETEIADEVKQMIVAAQGDCTTVTYTPKAIGHRPVRVLVNALSERFAELEAAGDEDGKAALGDGALEKAMKQGDTVWGSVMCGQVACHIHAIEPAAAIVDRIYEGANQALAEGE